MINARRTKPTDCFSANVLLTKIEHNNLHVKTTDSEAR